ncbi:MAG: GAF domain-containing sensor histidine kinase [Syntrophaceae bacterium]|nr:GAF domain-containing sensor histidine kinase [Syntrophaceae bacterium]
MAQENPAKIKASFKERRKGERRRTFRRKEDQLREEVKNKKTLKLHSLLELGRLIGLDLQIDEILLKISQKACEVMEADRCSLFLYDPKTDELWSTVALGMAGEIIRIPTHTGLAGHCFQSGESLNLEDAYSDPRFNKEVDAQTGYHTQSVLCVPLYNREGSGLGVIQLLNKKNGFFTEEDETFLRTFGNHVSVFIEMAQLQKARVDALEQSRKELEKLNRVKSKALDHLSHEMRTPLAVIQGTIRLLKRRVREQTPSPIRGEVFESLEKNLNRLSDIQQETDQIIRTYQKNEKEPRLKNLDIRRSILPEPIQLSPFIEHLLDDAKRKASHRDLQIELDGGKEIILQFDSTILKESFTGLLKNAIENTPDEGVVKIILERKAQWVQIKVMDFGVGITKDNQRHLFDGLFHTQDTELYTSKNPYDFGAGGKGLDLLRIKAYGQRFGFDISEGSQRCIYLPTDRDLCPGKISLCPHCRTQEDCLKSGGSTFCLSFSNY